MTNARAAYEKAVKEAEARATSDPSNAGAQTDLAEIYSRLGALHYAMATSRVTSGAKKREDLMSARSWYQRSAALWRTLRESGTLNPINEPDLQGVVAELTKVESALGNPK